MPRGYKRDGSPICPPRLSDWGSGKCEWCDVQFLKLGPRQRFCAEHKMVAWRNCAIVAKFGITIHDLRIMHNDQKGLCGICEDPIPFNPAESAKKNAGTGKSRGFMPDTDHCHVTGKVRGLLCHLCNSRLGTLEDELWVTKAQAYLLRTTKDKND